MAETVRLLLPAWLGRAKAAHSHPGGSWEATRKKLGMVYSLTTRLCKPLSSIILCEESSKDLKPQEEIYGGIGIPATSA